MIDANGQPQSVLVLGGGSDIAAALVERLVRSRCERVILAGPNFATMEPVRERLQAASSAKVDLLHFDLSNTSEIASFVKQCFTEFGPIDSIVLAAGVLGEQDADESDSERVQYIASVNYLGPVVALTEVANAMKVQGFGLIVVLSSVAGERVRRSNYLYGSTKAGLDGFALGMGDALRDFGVRMLVVRPGFVKTKMTSGMKSAPLAIGPEEVGADIANAIESGRDLIWSPKAIRYVISAYRHLPRAIARKVPF